MVCGVADTNYTSRDAVRRRGRASSRYWKLQLSDFGHRKSAGFVSKLIRATQADFVQSCALFYLSKCGPVTRRLEHFRLHQRLVLIAARIFFFFFFAEASDPERVDAGRDAGREGRWEGGSKKRQKSLCFPSPSSKQRGNVSV